MSRFSLQTLRSRYDTAIWIRVIGTILTAFAGFMIRPFLALYLYDKLDDNLIVTTMVVGLQPLTGLVAGLVAGGLSDRYGRKPVMVAALVIEAVSIGGYIWADSLLTFALITILNGIGGSLYFPAANAQIADVVPEERRAEVFALMHTALNLGAALGPLCGVAVYKIDPNIAFAAGSLAFLLYCLLVLWKVPETLPASLRKTKKPAEEQAQEPQEPKLRLSEHPLLVMMALAYIPFTLLYSQVETILPQHLKTNFEEYLTTFATLMTVNGALVVCLQLVIARYAERFPTHKVIAFSYLMLTLTAFGYGWSRSFLLLIVAELFFTLGEMLNGPQIQKAVSIMAPEHLRGRYFAFFFSSWGLTGTLGPMTGAVMFGHFGGAVWFSVIGGLLLVAGLLQYRLVKRAMAKWQEPSAQEAAVSV
jgi:MFS family permease